MECKKLSYIKVYYYCIPVQAAKRQCILTANYHLHFPGLSSLAKTLRVDCQSKTPTCTGQQGRPHSERELGHAEGVFAAFCQDLGCMTRRNSLLRLTRPDQAWWTAVSSMLYVVGAYWVTEPKHAWEHAHRTYIPFSIGLRRA